MKLQDFLPVGNVVFRDQGADRLSSSVIRSTGNST